jgi:two-component system NarL family sensor kinase
MNRKHGLFTRLEIQGQVDTGSEPVRILLYRASQEILFNIVKHSGVSEAELRLQRVGGELLLTISDNGRGFDPSLVADTAGFGLMHIRERVELLGGGIRIKSTPGRGSTVRIVLPDKT